MENSFATVTGSLLNELGQNPRQNIGLIVERICGLLRCESAAFGCIEEASGTLRFRAVQKIPARPSTVRELARRICSAVISGGETACDFGALKADAGLRADEKAHFKSFLGHPVALNGRNTGALVALHHRSRRFSERDRRLLAFLSGIVAIEENRHQREETLNRRIALEAMLKDLSTKAVAIEDTSAFIGEALTMLGTRMAVGGAFFWEFNPAQKTLSNTHEWLAKGQAPKKPSLQDIPIATLPWAVSRLMKGEILRISDARELPGKSERGLLEEIGVKACLVLPLFSRENFFGFMGFECFNGPKSWLPEDVQILQTAAEIMMRCIENRQLTRELIASQKNLEKTVGKKTLALRKTNRRLAAEIAAHMESIAELKRREADLAERNKAYMELSNALAALVSNPRAEADPDGQCLIHRLTNLVDPAVANRAAKGPDEVRDKYMGTLRSNLRQLSSLLTTKKSFVFKCLTRMEIQVAELIMQDKGNKEIADLLNLSRRTVEVHRYNIRKKLQFDKSRVNLKTYLLSME